jgi:hypothetical protein
MKRSGLKRLYGVFGTDAEKRSFDSMRHSIHESRTALRMIVGWDGLAKS